MHGKRTLSTSYVRVRLICFPTQNQKNYEVSIHTADHLFFSVVYLFTRPFENNYIDRAHAFFLSFCYALKRLSCFFLYIPTKNPLSTIKYELTVEFLSANG